MVFENRLQAGKILSEKLKQYSNNENTIVIGLPRGGVVIAKEISKNLNLPLDIIITRKLGAPHNPELAIGAITQNGEIILDNKVVKMVQANKKYINEIANKEKKEAERRLNLYRNKKEPLNLKNKTIILTDDGIATGNTIKAAIKTAKNLNAKKIILAIPVAPKQTINDLKKEINKIICILKPENFTGIGQFYKNFEQVSDEKVIKLMEQNNDK